MYLTYIKYSHYRHIIFKIYLNYIDNLRKYLYNIGIRGIFMFNDFLEYINKFMSKEELAFAFLGLIFLIVIWVAGRKV